MARLTSKTPDGQALLSEASIAPAAGGFTGEAAERLARFEDLIDELAERQAAIGKRLETLRNEGKKNSVKFRELFAEKLTNTQMLAVFQARGLV